MTELVLHRGAVAVLRDDLDLIPLPERTESYQPVSHYELANTLTTIGGDILTDYVLVGEDYALARSGQQMFAVLKFQKDNSDMALSIGFRNSYDRSMSIGFCIGASVFVCDNLALYGDITVMRKHTKNVYNVLEDLAITTLYKSQHTFDQIVADSHAMKAKRIDNDQAFRCLGWLYGEGVLSPRQLPVVKDTWLKPRHDEFKPRNMWSFYNACTEGLKSTAPMNKMEKHVKLHSAIREEIVDTQFNGVEYLPVIKDGA